LGKIEKTEFSGSKIKGCIEFFAKNETYTCFKKTASVWHIMHPKEVKARVGLKEIKNGKLY
jgi:hypothetical protein